MEILKLKDEKATLKLQPTSEQELKKEKPLVLNLKDIQKPLFLEKPLNQYSEGKNRKKIIAVGSAGKGGTGKSTIALMLALALQEKNQNTVIVDFDIPIGDISTMLGMTQDRCISDFFGIPDDLASEKVRDNLLLTYHNGLKVLPALRNLKEEGKVNYNKFVDKLFYLLRSFDVVVVDTGPNFESATMKIFEVATDIIYVSDDYETTFQNIYQGKKVLEEQGIDLTKMRLIVNRSNKISSKIVDNIAKLTSINNVFFLPYVENMPAMVDSKKFISIERKNTPYKKFLDKVMRDITPELYSTNEKKGLLSRVFGSKE